MAAIMAMALLAACTGTGDDDDSPAAAPETSAACQPSRTLPKQQVRGMWIASVRSIDWPSKKGLTAKQQQDELVGWLDLAKKLRLNTVILQVRPTGDAFWPSKHEPWSQWLTGTQGRDPGYDPLAFAVREAHERNLELHTWFNPYRASFGHDAKKLVPDHPARKHPDWMFRYGDSLYYDPGVPAAREFVQQAVLDAVRRYDIDAVLFDDYLYPYPLPGKKLPDAKTYRRYGRGFDSWSYPHHHPHRCSARPVG